MGFASPFFSFADTDGAEGDATVSVPAIASPDGDAKNGDEPDKKKDKKYKPGAAARSDIWLLVKAGILTRDIYGKSFERSIDAYELNGVLLSLHRFMGGSWFDEPASVEDESVIDAEGNPVWAVERGAAAASLAVTAINSKSYLWADTREIFFGFLAENSVADESKAGAAVETATGAAIEVTTGATTEVTTGAPLDTVTDALSDDTVGAPSDAVTDADVDTPTGASVEATTDATVGVATGASHYAATDYTMDTPAGAAVDTTTDASISAEPAPKRGITREDMFMLISRMVWEFDRENMEGIAPIPDTPAVQGASGEEFYRNDVYLYWEPVKYAETYIVKIYDDSENMLKSIRVGKPALNITEDSEPSFRAVFGEDGEGRRAYYTVQAVSAHGIRSEKTEPMGFTALNFDSARERYGKDYLKYEDGEEGKKHQTTVTLRVWRDVGGEKIPATINLSVHKKIAADVKRIFGEYFSGEEQFPIQSIGGFSIREKRSEHNYGTAIDINPNENYMVGPGGAESGAFWDPGESDYSIPKGSELVRAFERHGWYWAGDGWGETYDYMHFSFMGS
ncbi:MAG: M15 family metallopeptidase [Clostridiales Family XIII bacterium]|nr:M15 family metallopeptidase [Clostridiales Family XIII bacterium]